MGRVLPYKPKDYEAREFEMPDKKPVGTGCIGSIVGGMIASLLVLIAVLAPLALVVWLITFIKGMVM